MREREPQVFGYCRASSKKQVESPDTQKEMKKKYAVFNNLGDVSFFIDPATSGKVAWQSGKRARTCSTSYARVITSSSRSSTARSATVRLRAVLESSSGWASSSTSAT